MPEKERQPMKHRNRATTQKELSQELIVPLRRKQRLRDSYVRRLIFYAFLAH
jgi:hypothetical protein